MPFVLRNSNNTVLSISQDFDFAIQECFTFFREAFPFCSYRYFVFFMFFIRILMGYLLSLLHEARQCQTALQNG